MKKVNKLAKWMPLQPTFNPFHAIGLSIFPENIRNPEVLFSGGI